CSIHNDARLPRRPEPIRVRGRREREWYEQRDQAQEPQHSLYHRERAGVRALHALLLTVMRVAGADPNPLQRLFPLFMVLALIAAVVGLTLWGRQQESARRIAENRADLAESQLVAAEASLTAVVRVSASASPIASGTNEAEQ